MVNAAHTMGARGPTRVGLGALAFVLALVSAVGMLALVWSVFVFVFSGAVSYGLTGLVAAPVSALAAAGSVSISRRQRVSGLWGILGALLGIVSPVVVLVVLLITWALFEWPVLMD